MGQIHYVTYVSRMTLKAGVTPRTLSDIMTVAQRENLAHQITGFLCFGNGYFFQYIEGEKSAIEQLFGNIQRDGRNRDVTLKSKGVIEQRLFQDWQMLMVNINNPETHEDVINAFLPVLSAGQKRQRLISLSRSCGHTTIAVAWWIFKTILSKMSVIMASICADCSKCISIFYWFKAFYWY